MGSEAAPRPWPFPTGTAAPKLAPAAAVEQVDDPRPQPPPEPQLEDCCGSGCVVCVFDAYEMAQQRYAQQLAAWQARHPQLEASA